MDHHVEHEPDHRDQQPDMNQAGHPADIGDESVEHFYH
jgi:hypothetical protein